MSGISENIASLSPQEKREILAQLMQKGSHEGAFNLSVEQRRLWFLGQREPPVPTHTFATFTLRGELDAAALRQGLIEIAQRHEILRATFSDLGGWPVRKVAPSVELSIPVKDLRQLPKTEQETQVHRLVRQDVRRPFDLSVAPLFRAALIRVADEEHVLLVTMHQIIADDWSMDVFVHELAALYATFVSEQPAPSPKPPTQFSDFVVWERECLQGEEFEPHLCYWRERLAGVPILELPTDRPHPPVRTEEGARCFSRLPTGLVKKLEQLGQRQDATLFMTMLAAFQVLLMRYSRQQDVAVGALVANRRRPEWKASIGPYMNSLVLRTDLSGNPTFTELLGRVREVCLEAFEHRDMPFEKLVDELQPERDLSRTPLFQARFVLRDAPLPSLELPALKLTPLEVREGVTLFDLTLYVTLSPEGMHVQIEYNTALFDEATIERMLGHLQALLEGIGVDPNQQLSALPLITEAERRQLLITWNQTAHPYSREHCLHELVGAQAERSPDTVAVVSGGGQVTYQEINRRANQLAHYLRSLGVGAETPVGIVAERSVETIVALLAVLKAGGAYVPMDPSYPLNRLRFMLEDSQAKVLITRLHLRDRLPAEDTTVVCLDTDGAQIAAWPETNPAPLATPENLANVIYTSGSTGRPKGVLVPHRALVHSTSARCVAFSDLPFSQFVFMLLVSFSFDASGVAIYWTLSQGGRLLIPTEDQLKEPSLLRWIIEREQVSHFDWPASLYQLILGNDASPLGSLHHIEVAGEACPPQVAETHRRLLPSTRLVNNYGPTETAIFCTSFDCRNEHSLVSSVPIGRPIANMRIYLLDKHLNPVPIGVLGEIYIGGEGVARGYLDRPDLTAERFVPNPFSIAFGERLYKSGDLARYLPDGNIDFRGRTDNQVKIRGFRIELGEIENALLCHPDVDQVVVVAREDTPGDKRLVAYIVPRDGAALSRNEMIPFIDDDLPHYMVPKAFVFLEQLPRTPNAKIDLKALPVPDAQRPDLESEFVAPRTPLEAGIAQAFAAVLGVEQVGRDDDFFCLGGNSLLVTRLASRLSNAYDVVLPVFQIFQVPTVAGIAHTIDLYQKEGYDSLMAAWDTAAQLEMDVVLDATITPEGLPMADILNPSHILLTGATGYLGAFLLQQLLDETEVQVFCLVRASNPQEGMERIKKNLQLYRLWNDSFRSRIHPVVGDLAKPLLGLSPAQFSELATTIDAIYHAGAMVNFIYPYVALKAPNVQGTQEILRLACQEKVKAVHHISTLDVLLISHTSRPFLELDLPKQPTQTIDGYGRSKWVAEKIVAIARDRGVPVCIYRPGLMSSHTETGACNMTDYLLVGLKGFLQLGVLPQYDWLLNAMPVDYASRAIFHLSRQKESFGKHFHLWNLHPVLMSQIYDWIRSYGYKFEVVPYLAAHEQALEVEPSHTLYPLIPLFVEEGNYPEAVRPHVQESIDPRDECRNTLQALKGSRIECPPMEEDFVHRGLSYLIDQGFLDPPDAQRK